MGGSYPSAKVQSVYSTAPADWARAKCDKVELRKNLSKLFDKVMMMSKLLSKRFCSNLKKKSLWTISFRETQVNASAALSILLFPAIYSR